MAFDLLDLPRGWVAAAVTAASEALFPTNDEGVPDWLGTDTPARALAYLDALPPRQRHQLWALLCGLEWAGPTLGGLPGRRYSSLPVAQRLEVLRRWAESPFWALQMLSDAVKGTLGMVYMSHDAVAVYTGAVHACARPWDPFQPPYDPDALAAPSQQPAHAHLPPTAAAPLTPAGAHP